MLHIIRCAKLRELKNTVNALYRIGNDHIVFAHIHEACHSKRYNGRYDDIKQHVKQQLRSHRAVREPESTDYQESENAVYRQRIQHHRSAHIERIRRRPLLVIVDRSLEFFKREHGLAEGFHDRDAADILNCLV